MKKIALFMAFAAISLTSCSSDDNNSNTPVLNAQYLTGAWAETAPDPDMHALVFHGDSVTLTRQFSIVGKYAYEISGKKLLLSGEGTTTPTEHNVTIVSDSLMKISNMVIASPWENTLPAEGTITFKKSSLIID